MHDDEYAQIKRMCSCHVKNCFIFHFIAFSLLCYAILSRYLYPSHIFRLTFDKRDLFDCCHHRRYGMNIEWWMVNGEWRIANIPNIKHNNIYICTYRDVCAFHLYILIFMKMSINECECKHKRFKRDVIICYCLNTMRVYLCTHTPDACITFLFYFVLFCLIFSSLTESERQFHLMQILNGGYIASNVVWRANKTNANNFENSVNFHEIEQIWENCSFKR